MHILNIYIPKLFGPVYSLTELSKACPFKIGNSCCKYPLIYPPDRLAQSQFTRFTEFEQFTQGYFLQAGLSQYSCCLLWLLYCEETCYVPYEEIHVLNHFQ